MGTAARLIGTAPAPALVFAGAWAVGAAPAPPPRPALSPPARPASAPGPQTTDRVALVDFTLPARELS